MASPRKRNYAAEYQRRLRSYAERNPGASRQEARGHADEAQASFLRYIHEGDTVMLADHIETVKRRPSGRWDLIEKQVVPEDPQRPVKTFKLRGLSDAQLASMIKRELAKGAVLTPAPSLDQRRLLSKEERP